MVRALVAIAEGSEEIEAVSVIDILRRADVDTTVAGVSVNNDSLCITMRSKTKVCADVVLDDKFVKSCKPFDLIVVPGGLGGAETLAASKTMQNLLKEQERAGRWIGAICAAPAVVLAPIGLLEGRKATCYPSFADKLPAFQSQGSVIISKKIITSQAPGTAIIFGLGLVEALCGFDKAQNVAKGLVYPYDVSLLKQSG